MLSEKIVSLRRKNGLSQEQLAEKLGVSRQAISKWEGGLSTPELDKLKALSKCFHITIDELIGNEGAADSEPAREEEKPPMARKARESRLGIFLCLGGAVCLILFSILAVLRPVAVDRVAESSMLTLNGTGILIALFSVLMLLGMILIFKKK